LLFGNLNRSLYISILDVASALRRRSHCITAIIIVQLLGHNRHLAIARRSSSHKSRLDTLVAGLSILASSLSTNHFWANTECSRRKILTRWAHLFVLNNRAPLNDFARRCVLGVKWTKGSWAIPRFEHFNILLLNESPRWRRSHAAHIGFFIEFCTCRRTHDWLTGNSTLVVRLRLNPTAWWCRGFSHTDRFGVVLVTILINHNATWGWSHNER
jgi:hypothetical protein